MKYKLFDPPRLTGKYLSGVLASGWLTTGPENARLKADLEERFQWPAERIVLAASATAGFQAIVDSLRLCTVSITDSTWPGMHQAIRHADCERREDPSVVVTTDIGGRKLIDPEWVWLLPGTHVRDACHSWWPEADADYSVVSFYPTKLCAGAEGGAVFCRREEDARALEDYLYCGLRPGAAANGEEPRVCGRKANMTDVAAALNREALGHFDAYTNQIYWSWEALSLEARKLGIPLRDQPVRPYLAQVETDRVPEVRAGLAAKGIPSAWNFRPAGLVTLPCGPHIGPKEARDIMETVDKVLTTC